MSQLTRQEALNVLAKGESTSQTLQEQTCWSKIAQDGINLSGINKNIKIVQSGETIQSAIDFCPVAAGNLKEGFTNPYVINVPPGHEKEYYSLVRNASAVATDKRNVKVVYEKNPEGIFTETQFDNCNSTTDWSGVSTTLTLDSDYNFEGENCIKAVNSGAGSAKFFKTLTAADFRGYQGLLIDIDVNTNECANFALLLRDSDSVEGRTEYQLSDVHTGNLRITVYFPLHSIKTTNSPDLSNLNRLQFYFTRVSGYTDPVTVYFDNIRLIKTIPHKTAILRFDDSTDEHWSIAAKQLDAKGWKGNFAVSSLATLMPGVSHLLTREQIRSMQKNGHNMVNHCDKHRDLKTQDKAETHQSILTCQNFLDAHGCTEASRFFVRPGMLTNEYVQPLMQEIGMYGICHRLDAFPAQREAVNNTAFAIGDGLQRFVDRDYGGIIQIVVHTITNETNFVTFLDWVEENFSEIITFSQVVDHFPVKKRRIRNNIAPPGVKETLSGDFLFYSWHGKRLVLDPAGARKVIPCDGFNPFEEITLINTADAAEAITFDPTFTAAGAHDGAANATILTDSGESWVVGQLVGRTITNTTDVSSGVITANTATTVTAGLSGGTDDDWDIADNYTITPAGLNQAVAQNERGQFVYDGEGWLKIYVG